VTDVVCFGDLLIDFVPTTSGLPLADVETFHRAPGGAAANVAVGLARLGAKSAFMGKVGDDVFGHLLADTLRREGVDTGPLRFDARARTALAFVSLKADGERDFLFYRHPSADMLFTTGEVDAEAIAAAPVFHFDSISLAAPGPRETALFAADQARGQGKLVSFDANLRLPLWASAEEAKAGIRQGLARATIAKFSDDELDFMTGARDPASLRRELWHDGLKLMVLSIGKAGSILLTATQEIAVPTFKVDAVDTTGAGDGFVAGLLAGLLHHPDRLDDRDFLFSAGRFANAVGALTTTERGAIPALPTRDQVQALLAQPD
jgi:fructokinase